MGLLTLKTMARDSITFALLDPVERSKILSAWERRWDVFVQDLIRDGL